MCLAVAFVKYKVLIIGDFQKRTLSFLQIQKELFNEGFKEKYEEINKEIKQLKEDNERSKIYSPENISKLLSLAETLLTGVCWGVKLITEM